MKKEKILVSACLLGKPCRYDGKSKPNPAVIALDEKYETVAVCPECDGGLPTPRIPSERVGDRVMNAEGADVSEFYRRGAEIALDIALEQGIRAAVMKARSPSCGKGCIYDGSFSRRLVERDGVAAELLIKNGISVYTEEETDKL
ncbi:MAG: DUF523 domain-containing protein [Clostridia bacterium]|nr:DUF523 domain-containing protein [Clostridia bacterium]